MNDSRLLTLLTLVKMKNYTQTAQRLFITQPAVTHHIKSLENEYDIKIFEGNKGFELTAQGQILFEYARRMLDQAREVNEAIANSFLLKKNLNLGITFNSAMLLSCDNLLNCFFDIYNSSANIYTESKEKIYELLKQGKIDCAIIDGPYDDENFEGILLSTQNIVPVCYSNGKFKEIKRVTRDMLKNNALVLGDNDSSLCQMTLQSLKNSNINIKNITTYHSNSPFIMGQLIKNKDGIGFMYQDFCSEFNFLKKMELLNFKSTQLFYLIYSQNSFDKSTIKKLVNGIRKWKEQ